MRETRLDPVYCKETSQRVTIQLGGILEESLEGPYFIPNRLICLIYQDKCKVHREARTHDEECPTKIKLRKRYISRLG